MKRRSPCIRCTPPHIACRLGKTLSGYGVKAAKGFDGRMTSVMTQIPQIQLMIFVGLRLPCLHANAKVTRPSSCRMNSHKYSSGVASSTNTDGCRGQWGLPQAPYRFFKLKAFQGFCLQPCRSHQAQGLALLDGCKAWGTAMTRYQPALQQLNVHVEDFTTVRCTYLLDSFFTA